MPPTDENNMAMMKLDEIIENFGLYRTFKLLNEVVNLRRYQSVKGVEDSHEFKAWDRIYNKIRYFIMDLPNTDDGEKL